MAEPIGIKWNAWARYEAGGALPGAEILARICRVHNCSSDWLLGIERGETAARTVRGKNAAPGEMTVCAKCPFKKAAENFQKILAK